MGVLAWLLVLIGLGRALGMQSAAGGPRRSAARRRGGRHAVFAANATPARSKREECTSSQVSNGCCMPLGDTASTWSFATTTFHTNGVWSSSDTFIRFDFADDSHCGGIAWIRQQGTATLTMNDATPIDLTLSMSGVAEAQYETFRLYVDNVLMVTVQATDGHGGSACQAMTCIMCDVSMPSTTFSLAPGAHVIRVEVDSMDGYYHQGAFFQISFAKESPVCGSCTCTSASQPTPPTPAPTATPTPVPAVPPAADMSVAGKGDPHLSNVLGHHFDLLQPGRHVLMHVPMWAKRGQTLLKVVANATRMGGACTDIYFTEIMLDGGWVRSSRAGRGRGVLAFTTAKAPTRSWMKFGPARIKIVRGRTSTGTVYLNIMARLKTVMRKYRIGGLLGEGDHTFAATPVENCRGIVNL